MAKNDPDFMLSLARGLAAMRALADGGPRLSIGDVARITHVSRASAGRCLHTLETLGYAAASQGTYELTPMVLSLASNYLAAAPNQFGVGAIARIAQPVLERVSTQLNESASLAVLDDADIIYIARAAARRILSVELAVGSRLPAACTSMGRVLLANLSADLRSRYLNKMKLHAYTPHTIVNKAQLRAELDKVRAQGYAIVDQELEIGLRSIAVPVRRKDHVVVAAVNAGVHVARADSRALCREFLPVLRRAAEDITASIAG
jgi:IclR family transcriptional regulator, pca regulon regulatory protein